MKKNYFYFSSIYKINKIIKYNYLLYAPTTFFCQYYTFIIHTDVNYYIQIHINHAVFPHTVSFNGYDNISTDDCISLRNKT
jgi:hypothetical protein